MYSFTSKGDSSHYPGVTPSLGKLRVSKLWQFCRCVMGYHNLYKIFRKMRDRDSMLSKEGGDVSYIKVFE